MEVVLETRESHPEPIRYSSALPDGTTLPQAMHILLGDLGRTFDQTAAELRQTGELDEAKLVYGWGESYPTAANRILPYMAAAFAALTGKTADELSAAELTAEELAVLRTVFGKMSGADCTLTETDVTLVPAPAADAAPEEDDVPASAPEENGVPAAAPEEKEAPAITTRRTFTMSLSFSGDVSPLGIDAAARERYEALRGGAEWEKLVSLCGGDAWVESGAGAPASSLREDVVRLALAQQGKIDYRWGGKHNALGRSAAWDFPQQSESGEIYVDGLDCSGFVTWVFINAAGTAEAVSSIGEGTGAQRRVCEEITREELQPGDLVFGGNGSPGSEHIGIVTGFSDDGRVVMCHCMQGGVTVSFAEDFDMTRYYRPAEYYELYETPDTVPEISAAEYASAPEGTVWLVTVSEAPGTRCRWTFDGEEMLFSEKYGAWCALTTTPDAAETRLSRLRQNGAAAVSYNGDVNASGVTDINDAQTIYTIGCGQQSFEAKNAVAWLQADLNGDGKITTDDASEILRLI